MGLWLRHKRPQGAGLSVRACDPCHHEGPPWVSEVRLHGRQPRAETPDDHRRRRRIGGQRSATGRSPPNLPVIGPMVMRNDNPFIKVSGKLADFLGLKASSGRYIARGALTSVEDAFRLWKETGGAIDDAVDDATQAARDAARSVRDQLRAQTISNKQRSTQSLRNRTGEPDITREKYTRQVKSGERKYQGSSEKEREAKADRAAKAADTRLGKRARESVGETLSAPHPNRKKRTRFLFTNSKLRRYERNRERKLRGEWIEDPDWFEMMDTANALKDHRVLQLRASPPVAGYGVGK